MSTASAPADEVGQSRQARGRVLMLDPGGFTPYYDVNLAEALARRGWDVSLVTSDYEFEPITPSPAVAVNTAFFGLLGNPRRRRRLGLRRFRVFRVVAKGACYPIDLARLTLRSRQGGGGILHVQWAHLPWLDAAVWKYWRSRGWRIVYTMHDLTPLPNTTPPFLSGGRAKLVAAADAVVVHTRADAEGVIAMGVQPGRVHVMPPAAPVPASDVTWDRAGARDALGLPRDAPTILFFGFLKSYKGVDVLLRSLPSVIAVTGTLRVIVAGEMMVNRSSLHALATRLGVDSSIHWAEGFVPSEAVGLYFAACDVVVLPYIHGSPSGVLLTAYAHGRPVVATDVGGASAFVEEGVSGFVVPAGDPVSLARALGEVLSKPSLARRMGERARRLAAETYTWDAAGQELDRIYRDLPA